MKENIVQPESKPTGLEIQPPPTVHNSTAENVHKGEKALKKESKLTEVETELPSTTDSSTTENLDKSRVDPELKSVRQTNSVGVGYHRIEWTCVRDSIET